MRASYLPPRAGRTEHIAPGDRTPPTDSVPSNDPTARSRVNAALSDRDETAYRGALHWRAPEFADPD